MAKSNPLAALGDAKTRTLVIAAGAVVLGITIYAIMQIGGDDVTEGEGSRTVSVPSSVKGIPGNTVPERYAELQRQENIQRAEEAEKKKGSAIPTILGGISDSAGAYGDGTDGMGGSGRDGSGFGPGGRGDGYGAGGDGYGDGSDGGAGGIGGTGGLGGRGGRAGGDGFGGDGLFGGDGGAAGASGRKTPEQLREERLQKQRDELAARRAERERQKELERLRKLAEQERAKYAQSIQQRAAVMEAQAQALSNTWLSVTPQAYVIGILDSKTDDEENGKNGKGSKGQGSGANAANQVVEKDADGNPITPEKKKVFIKAGTILFGVLDTAINTDEQGPVLATIVHGRLKGARLLGTLDFPGDRAEAVILKFQTMSVPDMETSLAINAVAIDQDTARTALASDVDHHYLLRYGSLFASAFIQGYGQAVSQQGTTTTSPNGTQQETKPKLSGSEQFYAALGQVGEEWANAARPLFDTPNTVTVNQGIGLGLLFLSDVDVTPTEDSDNNG